MAGPVSPHRLKMVMIISISRGAGELLVVECGGLGARAARPRLRPPVDGGTSAFGERLLKQLSEWEWAT
jgi:hypothetical protein